jgi:hypothetical protein
MQRMSRARVVGLSLSAVVLVLAGRADGDTRWQCRQVSCPSCSNNPGGGCCQFTGNFWYCVESGFGNCTNNKFSNCSGTQFSSLLGSSCQADGTCSGSPSGGCTGSWIPACQ